MKKKEISKYILYVVIIVSIAFVLDLISASVNVTLSNKIIHDINGTRIVIPQIIYPLWHQIISLIINFLYGLAAAVFITVFIANKLQKEQHDLKEEELENLNNAINVNVFDSLFKTIIPKEIFKVIKQEIIENKVIRKEAKWIYDFSIKNKTIMCRMTTIYKLQNISQKSVTNPIKLELNTLGGTEYNILAAECLDISRKVLVHYDSSNIHNNKNIEVAKEHDITTVSYNIEIPPEGYVIYKTIFERPYKNEVIDGNFTNILPPLSLLAFH